MFSVQLAPTAAVDPEVSDPGRRRSGRISAGGWVDPGLGVHYGAFTGRADGAIARVNGEVMIPQLIFDGTDPGSPLAGFMYMADGPEGTAPEGFVSPNDHWHYHSKLCMNSTTARSPCS